MSADSERSSRIPGFYRLPPAERLAKLEAAALDGESATVYRGEGLTIEDADLMVENVIATFALPNAVAVNFRINGEDRLVPMVVEEPSVVAAVSNMARLARRCGGFHAESDPSVMIGQIQLEDVADPEATLAVLRDLLPELETVAHGVHPRLAARGGGFRGFELFRRTYDEPGFPAEEMVVLHVLLDCVDAMGANMVNTLCEHLAPYIEEATGESVGLKILSNLADKRLSRAWVELDPAVLGTEDMPGDRVAQRMASAWRFAWADPYRATTHNKGVMNGIDAVAIATGNDWRAIEAGAHAHCCRDGAYRPMTVWRITESGSLRGEIELPMQFGTVGGPIRVHPTVQSNLKLLGASTASDLAAVAVAVGLAQNMGALRALATEGIQAGHMRMHARTVAATAGATREEVGWVVAKLCEEKNFSVQRAEELLAERRGE
ncbi:MAG: hydroxymethylglutaryl-CoA reductase, degradative [Deltaproteobacteria bacterium]|nr:MAG: hydroxymethylglutaryl-CoA reductase, degradative [Deltaproteobacteria bacterium]